MPEEGKKSGVFAQIIIAVVIAMCVGGTSPWWYKEIFGPKPDPVPPQVSGQGLVNSPQSDGSDLEKRQKQLEDELAKIKHDQQQKGGQTRQIRTQTNIAGTWQGGGSSYIITQNGNSTAMAEYTGGNLTAVGYGTINGSEVIFYVGGAVFNFTLSEEGDEMTATVTDIYGNQVPYTLTR